MMQLGDDLQARQVELGRQHRCDEEQLALHQPYRDSIADGFQSANP